MSLHYCGRKLKNISFISAASERGCRAKKKSKGCCKDKSIFIKVRDYHPAADASKGMCNPFKPISAPVFGGFFDVRGLNVDNIISNYHSSPFLHDNPMYLKHSVFIIRLFPPYALIRI